MSKTVQIYKNKIRINKSRKGCVKAAARTENMLIDDEINEGKSRAIGYL